MDMKLFLLLFCFWVRLSDAFITVPLDYNDPIISEAFCPSKMTANSKYSKYLTRETIRREVRRMMLEEPPDGDLKFFIPVNASLLAMYSMYYGETASPLRFFKAINSIGWSNAAVDTSPNTKYDPRYHFDAEKIQDGQDLLGSRHNYIVSSIIKDQAYPYARNLIGTSLHSIQDFYAHTTWVETKHFEILNNLGIPGLEIQDTAGPDDKTCRTCGKAKDGCISKVLSGSKLTSGYQEFHGPSYNSSKPVQLGKCSFGGSYDDSTGGINKASASPCFSPHHSLHDQAAELAIKASESYLSTIRYTIGNDHFRKLLDLYKGSALVVVMDTTGSMAGEINGVKEEVKKIVANVNPEVYILVPFNDPDFGPASKVGDGPEFISLLELLKADGGQDLPEMAWSGLQLALSITPEYSTLYMFTDAPGKDEHLFKSVLLLAESKHISVTIVYTDSGPSNYYKQIAELTGGKLIEVGKESFDASVPIIQAGVEESRATVFMRTFDGEDNHSFQFPVDDTIRELKVVIEGSLSVADFTSPSGELSHLVDPSNPSEMFVKERYSDTLNVFTVKAPVKGIWHADVKGTGIFEIRIEASSCLHALVELATSDLLPPRPGYKLLEGRPLEGLQYYVEVMLIGWSDLGLKNLTKMKLLNSRGEELSEVAYDGEMRDEIFIKTDPLKAESFFLSFYGYLNTGNPYERIYATLITPVSVELSMPLASQNLTGVAGDTVTITFDVINHGDAEDFTNKAINSKGYDLAAVLDGANLEANSTKSMVISFKIPDGESDWSVSEVVITSASKGQENNVNSIVSYLMVIPKDKDDTKPICITHSANQDCGSFNRESNCHLGNWSVKSSLQDDESGLSYIYAQPSGKTIWLSVPPAPYGNNSVVVSLETTCCDRKVDVIGVDEQGNIGKCHYDMGPLDGVSSLKLEDKGQTWIRLRWRLKSLRDDLLKYVLQVNSNSDIVSYEILCFDLVCSYTVTDLSPCSHYTFLLTPYYSVTPDGVPGSYSTITILTINMEPEPPTDAKLTQTANELTVSWEAPEFESCVEEYEVCFEDSGSGELICTFVSSSPYSMTRDNPDQFTIHSIASIGESGQKSKLICDDSANCSDARKKNKKRSKGKSYLGDLFRIVVQQMLI